MTAKSVATEKAAPEKSAAAKIPAVATDKPKRSQANKKGSFAKGHSGNPGGRPKEAAEVRKLAREYTQEAVQTLVSVMRDKKAATTARISASQEILNRGYGKPTQHVEADINVFDKLPIDDQRALLELIDSFAGSLGRVGGEAPTQH